jgi:hypothetical protein
MDFDQTWYILSPLESLEHCLFSRSKVKGQYHRVKLLPHNILLNFLRTKFVPSLVKIHWRMLILERSQGYCAVKMWPLDLWPWKSIGSQTLLRTMYVPSLVKIHWRILILEFKPLIHQSELGTYTKVVPFQEKSSFHFVVLWKLLNGMD